MQNKTVNTNGFVMAHILSDDSIPVLFGKD